MVNFRKMLAGLVLIGMLSGFSGVVFAEDQPVLDSSRGDIGGTVLPYTTYEDISECDAIMLYMNTHVDEIRQLVAERGVSEDPLAKYPGANQGAPVFANDVLGCAIKTGEIKLWMVPFYIRFALEFLIGAAGLLSVGALIYGGYLYLFAGITEDKEKGKKAIQNSLIGLALALSAWAIVNIVITFVSG